MAKNEVRSLLSAVELRADGDGRIVSGYAIMFDKPSQDLGGFIEYIDNGALKDVNFDGVYLVYAHDMNQPFPS